jgi:hypothetical protein
MATENPLRFGINPSMDVSENPLYGKIHPNIIP